MTMDHREAATALVEEMVAQLRGGSTPAAQPGALIEECESLIRAIRAFHMEGIRFRMFNVDRLLARSGGGVPAEVPTLFARARDELEQAGFHTRSHQAPG